MPTKRNRRKTALILLVVCFAFQSLLIYTDQTGKSYGHMSETAQIGRNFWQKNNCQACHQLYGFGGYLGPDLTNAAPRLSPEAIHAILSIGPKQMPKFNPSKEEAAALYEYLKAMSQTGQSIAKFEDNKIDEYGSFIKKIPWFEFK